MSLPEVLLWTALRRRPGGFRFRRQFPIEPYTCDFACLSARLVIEVDGEQHGFEHAIRQDRERDRYVSGKGWNVMRIAARDVLDDLDAVVRGILARCSGEDLA